MRPMELQGSRKDKDDIQVNDNEMVKELPENVIHQMLESGRCIAETEGYDQVFKVGPPPVIKLPTHLTLRWLRVTSRPFQLYADGKVVTSLAAIVPVCMLMLYCRALIIVPYL